MQTIAAESWEQLQALFHLAESTPATELDVFLQRACSDERLREQARSVILASRTGPVYPGAAPPLQAAAPHLRHRFGAYRVLEHIGSGGTGSVYLVERVTGTSVQKAALKVLLGNADNSFFTRSFAREEFILASLEHPCIPKLLDAGIADTGERFLVMEYAQGQALDAFCDSNKLSVDDRLRLVIRVCDAVAYAHRSLVVHLDLKPSNILASHEEPGIKLLDFGTSKLIEPDRALTVALMATPAYASPEQLRNEPLSTSSDVYALGAILFELLSGRKANLNRSLAMMIERSVREAAPDSLIEAIAPGAAANRGVTDVQLRRKLSGDLSTIVDKCMSPSTRDRYVSVDAFAEDLRRVLAGRPILARPQTLRYRAVKFFRRNRLQVSTAALALLLVIGSMMYGLWRQHQALVAAHRAVQMQDFLTRLFRLSHSGATGKPAATVADMLQVGAHILPSFISDPGDLRAARLSLAESMYDDDDTKDSLPILLDVAGKAREAGDVAAEAKASALAGDIEYLIGKPKEGNELSSRALALSHHRAVSPEVRTQITALYVSDHDDAGDRSEASMDMLRRAIAESERTHAPEEQTASAMNILGLGLQARGHLDEARPYFERSLAIYRKSPYATCDEAMTYRYLAVLKGKKLDYSGALPLYQRSYELERQCAGDDDLGTLSAQAWVAGTLADLGQPQQTIYLLEPAIERWRKVVGPDSEHMHTPLAFLSRAYLAVGRDRDAEATAREELRVLHGRVKQRSVNMAVSERKLAEALSHQGRFSEALPVAKAAVADYPEMASPTPLSVAQVAQAKRLLDEVSQHLASRGSEVASR